MAVRLADLTDLLQCQHGLTLGTGTTSIALMGWVRRKTDPNAFRTIMALENENDGTPTLSYVVFVNTNGDDLTAFGGSGDQDSGADASDVWLHVSYLYNGGTGDLTITVLNDSTSTTPLGTNTVNNPGFDPSTMIYLMIGAAETSVCLDMEFTSIKLITGLTFTAAELRTESQFFAKQKASGTALAWRLETSAADTNGLNEIGGAGPNLSNTGVVNGASRPGQLEAAPGGAAFVRPGILSVSQAVMRAATR